MPFIETTTSTQDWSVDAEGYSHTTRTFRVWGVAPSAFWDVITSIPHRDANATPPVGDKMPDYGHAIRKHSTPSAFQGAGGEGNATSTEVVLLAYRMRPISAIMFEAIAEYTNDPRAAPLGQGLQIHEMRSMVPIPYAKRIPVLPMGKDPQSVIDYTYGYVDAIQSVPMSVQQIGHTVAVQRGALTQTVQSVLQHTNELHTLPMMAVPCILEGADIRLRGVDWLDVTYRWQYQQGILDHSPTATQQRYSFGGDNGAWSVDNSTANSVKAFPERVLPLVVDIGTLKMLLPPYHTIEMLYRQTGIYRVPVWSYACVAKGGHTQDWRSLPGSEHFIW